MAATKATASLTAATASGTTSTYASPTSGCQSTWADLTTSYGALVTGRMLNGGTGPTVGVTAQIDVSPDNGTTVRLYASITGGVANNGQYDLDVVLPPSAMYARITFFGNTGQTVTCTSEIQKLTGI